MGDGRERLRSFDYLFRNCRLQVVFLTTSAFLLGLLSRHIIEALKVFPIGSIGIMLLCIGSIMTSIIIISAIIKEFPKVKDIRKIYDNVVYYPTVSFCIHPRIAMEVMAIEVITFIIGLILMIESNMMYLLLTVPSNLILEYLGFVLISSTMMISILTWTFIVLPIYFFSPVFGFRVRDRLVLVCTGYSDAEVISSEPVEVDGFVEKYKFPVETTDRDDLTIRIGYFKTGVYTLKPPDHGFFFLRTRGLCVFRDDWVSLNRRLAFELAREWEKLSMIYAALCLKYGDSPSIYEVYMLMEKVKNNVQKGLRARYLGVPISMFSFAKDGTTLGVLFVVYMIGSTVKYLGHPLVAVILISPISVLLMGSVILYCLTVRVRKLNKRAVVNCKWYNMILNKKEVSFDLYRFNNIINKNMFRFKRVLRRLNELDLG